MEGKAEYSAKDSEQIDTFLPLYNPLILKKVVEFLDVKALKKARTLSSLWDGSARKELMDQAWVTLNHSDDKFGRFLDHVESSYAEPSQVPYQHYRIQGFNLTQWNQRQSRFHEFWLSLGPRIKSLHLHRCMVERRMLGKILSAERTPNLETLILDECYYLNLSFADSDLTSSDNRVRRLTFRSDRGIFNQPFDFKYIWTMFPHLEDLVLDNLTQEESGTILKAAVNHRNTSPTALQLTSLNIFGPAKFTKLKIFQPNFEMLCSAGFPLTRLQIDLGVSIRDPDICLLIKSFSRTLETLIIWRGFVADKLTGFPFATPLPRLRTLEIPDNCLEDFGFIRFTPALRSLRIRQCTYEPMAYWTDIFKGMETLRWDLEPLGNLNYFRIEYAISVKDIEFLREIFPKLTQLCYFRGESTEIVTDFF